MADDFAPLPAAPHPAAGLAEGMLVEISTHHYNAANELVELWRAGKILRIRGTASSCRVTVALDAGYDWTGPPQQVRKPVDEDHLRS